MSIPDEHLTSPVLMERSLYDELESEVSAMAHLIVEAGIVPGVDPPCRCDACRGQAKQMANAGYLAEVTDRWWEK